MKNNNNNDDDNAMKRWPPENAHTALRLLLETRWVKKLFEEGEEEEGTTTTTKEEKTEGENTTSEDKTKKTNREEKKEDSIGRLESRYRGIKVDLLDAPKECAMRTCLVHCGAREAKLEGVGKEEEEHLETQREEQWAW